MRRPSGIVSATVVGAALLGGCAPVVMPAAPAEGQAPDVGPSLVVDLVNASDAEIVVSYEFESGNAGGGGEGSVPACERTVMVFGDVSGTYDITVGGTTVIDGRVPQRMPANGHLLVRVQVDRDGTASADGPPRWVGAAPAMANARLADCG